MPTPYDADDLEEIWGEIFEGIDRIRDIERDLNSKCFGYLSKHKTIEGALLELSQTSEGSYYPAVRFRAGLSIFNYLGK